MIWICLLLAILLVVGGVGALRHAIRQEEVILQLRASTIAESERREKAEKERDSAVQAAEQNSRDAEMWREECAKQKRRNVDLAELHRHEKQRWREWIRQAPEPSDN